VLFRSVEDVERVAPMALAHRRRRRPFDPPSLPPEELAEALARAHTDGNPPPPSTSDEIKGQWSDLAADALSRPASPVSVTPGGRPSAPPTVGPTVRGPVVGDRAPGANGPTAVAVAPTLRAAVRRGGEPAIVEEDLREPVRRRAPTRCVVLTVDTSGSMGTRDRAEAAAGAALGLLADAYRSRHRVALVTFRGTGAEVVLAPTASVEVARARLGELPTGGATPLAEGLTAALDAARHAAAVGDEPLIVLLTDGRATAGPDALDRAVRVAEEIAGAGIPSAVLDAEDGPVRLGCASRLAAVLGAPCLDLGEVSAAAVEGAVRDVLRSQP
jgi:magnesium chelatase subunit D